MKKVIRFIITLIVFVIILAGTLVCSYLFSTPSQFGESKHIATTWYSEDNNIKLDFGTDGEFTVSYIDSEEVITQGYYKIDEDEKMIKTFVLPEHQTTEFDTEYTLFCFTKSNYQNLNYDKNGREKATCDFAIGHKIMTFESDPVV